MRRAAGTPARPSLRAAALWLVVSLGAVACGSAPKPLPAYLERAGVVEHPKYPRSTFLTAVGLSPVSFDSAESDGRGKIAAAISSEVKQETVTYMTAANSDGRSRESASATSRTEISASFSRNDLIHAADRAESGGTFYVLVYLDRAKADAELAAAQQANLVSFKSFVAAAARARTESRAGEFAAARKSGFGLLPALDSSFVVRRAILGRGRGADEAAFLADRKQLLELAAQADSFRVVEVRVEGASSSEARNLIHPAIEAVRKLGLRAEEKTCEQLVDHAGDATELVLMPEESCGESPLGESCKVSVRIHARGCGGGVEGEGRVEQVKAINTSDREKARLAAWRQVTSDAVARSVRAALRGARVIEEGGGP